MENKRIVVFIVIILLAFVGYKLIAAKIQENKEKAVLQERARLDGLAKAPLEQCLNEIDLNTEAEVRKMKDIYSPSKQEYESCLHPPPGIGHGKKVEDLIASGKMTLEEYCKPPPFEEMEAEEQKIRVEAKVRKDECYKRYK